MDTISTAGGGSQFQVPTNIGQLFSYQGWRDVKTMVAVSGGPDSVALLRGLLDLASAHHNPTPKNLIVAHVNHGLRGSDSDEDANYVEAIANELGLEFHLANSIEPTETLDSTEPLKSGQNDDAANQKCLEEEEEYRANLNASEERLRDFRYDNLLALASRLGVRYLVTGHNQDDQVETILFRIFRGTGIGGLAGIPRMRLGNDSVTIVRPLLSTTREEIETYLDAIGQTYRVDASNSSSKYTRNFLRNELIPLVKARFGDSVPQSILRLGEHAEDLSRYLVSQSQPLDGSILDESPDGFVIDCRVAAKHSPIVLQNWLSRKWAERDWSRQSMTSDWWRTISAAIASDRPQILNLPYSIRFERRKFRATFSRQS